MIQIAEGEERAMTLDTFVLNRESTVLLIVDIQERLAAVMDDKDKVVKNCLHLIALAKMLHMPIVVTEQYPKGLGRTVSEIRSAIPDYQPIEKVAFNCCGEPTFVSEIKKLGRPKILVTGMETHICVLQTTVGLLKAEFIVHVVEDAVCSRTRENWDTGKAFMRDAGAVVTCTETALFQILRVAGTEEFKSISQRIK